MTDGQECPVRDKILVEHVAYLTARPDSRIYPFSTNIASLKGCRPGSIRRHDEWAKFPVRDKILVERTNPTTTRRPVRDGILVKNEF